MLADSGNTVEAESRRKTRSRWQCKIPYFQIDWNVCFEFPVNLKACPALVSARRRLRRHIDFDPDRLITTTGKIKRECIPFLSCISIDARNQRVGPFSRGTFYGRWFW